MSPRYKSPMSTGYRKPITVYDTDPRAKSKRKLEEYRASIGSEVIVEKAPIDNVVLADYEAPPVYWIKQNFTGTSGASGKYFDSSGKYNDIFALGHTTTAPIYGYLTRDNPDAIRLLRKQILYPGMVRKSSDSITWTNAISGFLTTTIRSIAYGNNLWIAVGDTGKINTSTDGTTWTSQTSGFASTIIIRSVAYGNGTWVAGGDSANLRTSTDGITWVSRNANFSSNNIRSIAYGNGIWVIGGQGGRLSTSTDAITWTSRNSNFSFSNMNSVGYGNNLWIAVGDGGRLSTSSDAITWTSRTSGFGSTNINSVAYGNGLWVIAGNSGRLSTSTDGITWTTRTSGFGSSSIQAVSYNNGIWMAVGADGKLFTSLDAISWTSRSSNSGISTIRAIGYGDGTWIVGGDYAESIKPVSLAQLSDGSLIIFSFVTYNGITKPVLIRTNAAMSQKIWEKEISIDSGNSPLDFNYTNGFNNIDNMYQCTSDPADDSIYISIVRYFPGTAPNFYDAAEFANLIKIDKNGNLIWIKRIWDTTLVLEDRNKLHITDLKCDNNSNLYIYGSRDFYKGLGHVAGDVSLLIKIDSSGNLIYKNKYFTGNDTEFGGISYNISFINDDDYLYLGHFGRIGNGQTGDFGSTTNYGSEILKINKTNGQMIVCKKNKTTNLDSALISVTGDAIYFISIENLIAKIYKFDKDFNLIYIQTIDFSIYDMEIKNILFDSKGDIYISGWEQNIFISTIIKMPPNESKNGTYSIPITTSFTIGTGTSYLEDMNVFTSSDPDTSYEAELDTISLNNTNNIIFNTLSFTEKTTYY